MKKSLLSLTILSSIFISTNVLSDELSNDADNFKGLNLGVGLSVVKYDSNFSQSFPSYPSDFAKYHSTNVVPRFDGSYSFELNDKWLLGVGLTLDLSPFNGDEYLDTFGTGNTKIRTTNHYSVYIEPTYAIDNSLAVFGKLSYQSSNIDAIWVGDGYLNDHMRLDGVGVGLGVKKLINQNIYVQLEGEYVDYSNINWSDSSGSNWGYRNNNSYSGTLSAGYHF